MREGLAAMGVGALAVACCGLLPLAIGTIGGAALAILFGGGALALLALALLSAFAWRRRRRSRETSR